jgi:hypothetical protein
MQRRSGRHGITGRDGRSLGVFSSRLYNMAPSALATRLSYHTRAPPRARGTCCYVYMSQTSPVASFSRTHCNTSRCPVCTALAPSLAGRVVLPHPLQHLQLPALSGVQASVRVPRAVLRPRPLQHRQVPALSAVCRRQPVPRAVVLPRPLHDAQVPGPSSVLARQSVPRAAALPHPWQRRQVPVPGGDRTRIDIRCCAATPTPLDSRHQRHMNRRPSHTAVGDNTRTEGVQASCVWPTA